MTYAAAVSQTPFSIRPPVSRAKDEKVVNPPQIPTFRNSTSFGEDEKCFNASAAASPIRKQPVIFTINVFSGKPSSLPMGSLLTSKKCYNRYKLLFGGTK